jgi:beta-glucosidase
MKRRALALVLALTMLLSSTAIPVFAAESAIKESASGFYYIEATPTQEALSAKDKNLFIVVDGLYFKDLNKNGELDPYEDWRLSIEERAKDLVSKMTVEEKTGALAFACLGGTNGSFVDVTHVDEILYGEDIYYELDRNRASMWYQINNMHVFTYIAAMSGLPKEQLDLFNDLQAIAEGTRLGIPLTFSGDRTYNTWGGMIDNAPYAAGVSHDPQLVYDLYSEYAKESVAIGYHQVFHTYGNEIGAWYGDEVNYISEMVVAQNTAYDDHNFQSHTKHFIARGGRNPYVNAKSPADLLDSWLIGWKAAVDAGTRWVMTNNNIGITPGVQTYFDKATFDLLREQLGYDGVIVLDWPLDATRILSGTGITRDGVDISQLDLAERYALILNTGIDMFSCYLAVPGKDLSLLEDVGFQRYFPEYVAEALERGLITEERLDLSVFRVMREKFRIGIFDNPFRDWETALHLIGSPEYIAEQFEIKDIYDINRARRSLITHLEERMMTQSTILLKNDHNLLPLPHGIKIYYESNHSAMQQAVPPALSQFAELVDDMEEADVIIIQASALNDAYEDIRDEALETGKPMVLIVQMALQYTSEPGVAEVEAFDAILATTYDNTPDHGVRYDFYRYVYPEVLADMVFGRREPTGKTVFEIGRSADDYLLSFHELAYDIGVDDYTRLYMAATVKRDPTFRLPDNLGDVLWPANFGLRYGEEADIRFEALLVPRTVMEVETLDRRGNLVMQRSAVNAPQKVGEPFEIMFIAYNDGKDGNTVAEVYSGDVLVGSKFISVHGGGFVVVRMEITLDTPGEHVIRVGDLSTVVVVEE